MYETTTKVQFSNIGKDGLLKLYELPRIFQDCSIQHSEAVGAGMSYLMPRNLAWFLTSWQIDIIRMPALGEELTVQTWPYEFKLAFGYRNYAMLDAEGNIIVKAYALWLHTDTKEMKPIRVFDEEVERYGFEPKLDMEYTHRKVDLPKDMEVVDQISVTARYADMYQHMNNAMYVDLASDYIPDGYKVNRIRVDYRKQTRIGEKAIIKVNVQDNRCFVAFYDEADDLHVGIELMLEKDN